MLPRNPSSEHYIFLLNQLRRPRNRLVPGAPLFASALSATTNFVETRDVDPFNWLPEQAEVSQRLEAGDREGALVGDGLRHLGRA